MDFYVQIKKDTVSYDVSDYLIECDPIPVNYEVDKNFMPIISSIDAEISMTAPIVPAKGDYFYLKERNTVTVPFQAVVRDVKTNYENKSYKITIESSLSKLTGCMLTVDILQDELRDTINPMYWKFPDNVSAQLNVSGNYQLLWVFYKMFEVAGLHLDTQDISLKQVGTLRINHTTVIYKGKDFCVDMQALFCANQQFASTPEFVETAQQVNFFEYMKPICRKFGYLFQSVGEENYKLIYYNDLTDPVIADDNLYGLEVDEIQAEYESQEETARYGENAYYYDLDDTDQHDFNKPTLPDRTRSGYIKDNRTKAQVEWLNNVFIMNRQVYENEDSGLVELGNYSQYVSGNMLFENELTTDYVQMRDHTIYKKKTDVILDLYRHISNKITFHESYPSTGPSDDMTSTFEILEVAA